MKWNEKLRLLVGAALLAATLCAVVAAPGFLSDRDSTAPLRPAQEAWR
jgi:hypothetical protein